MILLLLIIQKINFLIQFYFVKFVILYIHDIEEIKAISCTQKAYSIAKNLELYQQ